MNGRSGGEVGVCRLGILARGRQRVAGLVEEDPRDGGRKSGRRSCRPCPVEIGCAACVAPEINTTLANRQVIPHATPIENVRRNKAATSPVAVNAAVQIQGRYFSTIYTLFKPCQSQHIVQIRRVAVGPLTSERLPLRALAMNGPDCREHRRIAAIRHRSANRNRGSRPVASLARQRRRHRRVRQHRCWRWHRRRQFRLHFLIGAFAPPGYRTKVGL